MTISQTGLLHLANHETEFRIRSSSRAVLRCYRRARACFHGGGRGIRGKGTAPKKAGGESRTASDLEDQSGGHDKPTSDRSHLDCPSGLRHVVGRLGDPRALNAHWFENKRAQRFVNLHVDCFFDQLTDEEVTDIRIRPAFSRAETELVGLHSCKQLGDGPDRIARGDSRAVGRASVGVQSGQCVEGKAARLCRDDPCRSCRATTSRCRRV